MECGICNKEVNETKGLSIHLIKKHKEDISVKEYYDKYLKKENEGTCYFCNNDAIFFNLIRGYHRICNSKECLGKTRATGTYEFLMYKYNLSKDDAIKLMNERALERGIKIKNGLWKSFDKNENFFKEKSRQSVEFWLKRGYSEEESIKIKDYIQKDIFEKTFKKRHENKHLYLDVNTTQIGYWLKKGFNEEESKNKISERQRTFTLEKCINKYGIVSGTTIFNERQIKWSKSMKKSLLLNGNYKKDFSKIEKNLIDEIISRLNLNLDEHYSYINNQFFIFDKDHKKYTTFDFVLKDKKRVIEFNGNYWHCNPKYYKSDFFNKNKQMYAHEIWKYDKNKLLDIENRGYEVLIIWESDYKNDKEKTIQECLYFLNKKE